jgi:hypothetical protein
MNTSLAKCALILAAACGCAGRTSESGAVWTNPSIQVLEPQEAKPRDVGQPIICTFVLSRTDDGQLDRDSNGSANHFGNRTLVAILSQGKTVISERALPYEGLGDYTVEFSAQSRPAKLNISIKLLTYYSTNGVTRCAPLTSDVRYFQVRRRGL